MKPEEQLKEVAELFLKACQEGNELLFNALLTPLSEKMDMQTIVDNQYGGNVLHWSVNNGHLSIVKTLVERFPNLINAQSKNGSTPIHCAIHDNQEEIFNTSCSRTLI